MATPGPLITRAKLMLGGQQLADYRNSGFVGNGTVTIDATTGLALDPDADELRTVCDDICANVYNLLVDLHEGYCIKKGTITLEANQGSYPLPADCIKLDRIYYRDLNSGRRVEIPRERREDYVAAPQLNNFSGVPVSYEMRGMMLEFSPEPAQQLVDGIELQYVPYWSPPARDDDPINFPMALGWDGYVKAGIAKYFLTKSGEDIATVLQTMTDFEKKMRENAANRDQNHPPRVRDVGWSESAEGYRRGYWTY